MAKPNIMNYQIPARLAYNLSEAARAVGVSDPTMGELVHTPGFPAFRAGKRWVIPIAALERWLDEQAAKGGNIGA